MRPIATAATIPSAPITAVITSTLRMTLSTSSRGRAAWTATPRRAGAVRTRRCVPATSTSEKKRPLRPAATSRAAALTGSDAVLGPGRRTSPLARTIWTYPVAPPKRTRRRAGSMRSADFARGLSRSSPVTANSLRSISPRSSARTAT
jgi:hypothetical protein